MELNQFKYGVRLLGYLLCGVSLWLLADVFFKQYQNIEHVQLDSRALMVFGFCILVAVIGHINIVAGWYLQLRNKYPLVTFGNSYIAIGMSQIAKYLPGNVAHFIGRAILVKDIDSKADITCAMLIETVFLSLTAILFASLWSILYYLPAEINALSIFALTLLFTTGTIILVEVLRRRLNADWIMYKTLFIILGLNALSFFMHGYAIYLIASLFQEIPALSVLQYTLGFSSAFLVGYLLPGAPGGIGIREYAFILLFSQFLGAGIALEVIVIHRLLAIIGDLVFFLSAYFLERLAKLRNP